MRRTPRTIRHARFLAPLLAALLIGASTAAAVPAAETGGDAAAQGDFALQVYAPASGAFAVQPLADGVPVDALPTLRVPSANRSALPDPDDPAYAWLGTAGAAGWTTANAAAPDGAAVGPSFRVYPTATAAAPVTFGVSGITAPGSFAHYRVGNGNEASAPPREDGRYQFGTGVRSDGSAQGSTTTYSVSSQFRDGVSRFTAEGMYCVTFTAARGAETVSQEVRFAVGDTVADDAPCGTAADTPGVPEGPEEPGGGDDPGEPEEPEEPEEPGDGQDPGITVIENGHVDALYPELDVADDGTGHLALRARHQTLGTLDWDDFVLHSGQETQLRLPDTYTDDADYSFIADPGRTVWNSPQDGRSDGTTPWVGASTESPTLDGMPQAPVSVRLDAVTGPGGAEAPGDAVLWFQEAALLGKAGILYSTRTGLPGGYTWYLDSHAHFNWTFTAAGVYCMAFTVQARLPDGTLSQDSRQLTWAVGTYPRTSARAAGPRSIPSPARSPSSPAPTRPRS
ncbi:choice-of-anchor M domain-containing protein [Streptomyces sp. RFCAC02]|uniref:choice-of-anchor M domain-containing protein n=1 Tax=Streptomyces sp. RFCAC02 TaxID=2499143 RepID=UPI00101F7D33|nr:choice-of-anchor M domain-containing protein [Streptomyces sp. RFCAC02]